MQSCQRLSQCLRCTKKFGTARFASEGERSNTSNREVCQIVKNSANIRYVNFTGCSLTWRGAEHMAIVLKQQAMKRHGEAWVESLRYRRPDLDYMTGLRRVTFNCNMLVGDGGARAFAECLGEDLWLKDHVLKKSIIERVLMNGNASSSEYKWLSSPSSKDALKARPRKRTIVLGSGRKGKATIRIGNFVLIFFDCRLTSKKSASPGKKNTSVKDSYSPKPLPPGTKGFLPWRTAERAKRCRGGTVDNSEDLSVKMGVPVKVTVESASTSETEETEDLDVIHHPDLMKSLDKVSVTKYQQFQLELEECMEKLQEERRARVRAEERIMEMEVENARLRNLNTSLSEALHVQSVTNMILEDEGVLCSIENSFQKFHAFLDLLKDAGLGQLAVLAGIDKSDFGLLGRPQMNSTLSKPANVLKEKSLEERQEHTQNSKYLYLNLLFQNRDGNIQLSPGTSQSQMDGNNTFSAFKEIQEFHTAVQQLQLVLQKENEAQATNQTKEDKTRNSTQHYLSVKQNEQAKGHHSARQLATSLNSFTDSSLNINSNSSRTLGSSGGKSKNCSSKKYIPKATETSIANGGERGHQSRLQKADCSGTDTVESVSEIQESIEYLANT
ncbi:UNVERIFIED_CONTAM: hypothetical protein H355_012528 [Colinus virginianus]|nr:hypothetical protein H355_012528 [Colinus virginianus]